MLWFKSGRMFYTQELKLTHSLIVEQPYLLLPCPKSYNHFLINSYFINISSQKLSCLHSLILLLLLKVDCQILVIYMHLVTLKEFHPICSFVRTNIHSLQQDGHYHYKLIVYIHIFYVWHGNFKMIFIFLDEPCFGALSCGSSCFLCRTILVSIL